MQTLMLGTVMPNPANAELNPANVGEYLFLSMQN
jgi:hypothetical protein